MPYYKNGLDHENESFYYAQQLVEHTSHSVFLTGKAGTGKSTFLREITRSTQKKHVVVAPTGIAAINVRGVTIHSFFQLPIGPIQAEDARINTFRFNANKVKLIKELELVIIDEVSMVRADIMDAIDYVLRRIRKNNTSFGGVQLLLVGDMFQLEPVVPRQEEHFLSERYETPFFFSARAFSSLQSDLVNIELTKVYRQSDEVFIDLLNKIRTNDAHRAEMELLNERNEISPPFDDSSFYITLASRKHIVDKTNKHKLARLEGAEHKYTGKLEGTFPLSGLPTDLELTLKVGAQVIFVRNDSAENKRRWVNGTIGKIVSLEDDKIEVELENGYRYDVEKVVWENIKYEYDAGKKTIDETVIGTFKQFPIKLAWAITIHKSQGLTFDNVVVDLGRGAFAAGQLYVALSRCTSMHGLYLSSRVSPGDVIVREEVVHFYERNNDLRIIKQALNLS